MALTREIGLVLSVALFFLVPAIKYTEGNIKLRALFTILSFLLFYVLSFKDLFELGFTFATTMRMVVLILVNTVIYYILSRLKNQDKFFSLVKPISNIKYIAPIIIPLIFISINTILFTGPFPVFTFSSEFAKLVPAYREIFDISNPLTLDILHTLENLPRIDILFISLAMGSVFIFFKLIGIGRIIYHLKNNYQYSLVLILLIFLLFTWSFLLHSRFQTSDIRYISYFVPLLSVILIIGMKIGNVSSPYSKIFYCGFIINTLQGSGLNLI